MNAVDCESSTDGKMHESPDADAAVLDRVMGCLPDVARGDAGFVETACRVVAECNPRTALQEHAVVRLLRGMWRMKPLLAADNDELDEHALAAAERSQARAEASWCRLRRLELAEERARQRGAPRATQTRPLAEHASFERVAVEGDARSTHLDPPLSRGEEAAMAGAANRGAQPGACEHALTELLTGGPENSAQADPAEQEDWPRSPPPVDPSASLRRRPDLPRRAVALAGA